MFTPEQMRVLAKYEENFERAINANWWKAQTAKELREIYDTFKAATGSNMSFNPNCSVCVGELLRVCGIHYFESKKSAETALKSTQREKTTNDTAKADKAVKTRKTKK